MNDDLTNETNSKDRRPWSRRLYPTCRMNGSASYETPSLIHHLKAAEHSVLAALHFNEATKYRKIGRAETATYHAHIAREHLLQARLIVLKKRQQAVTQTVRPPFVA